MGVTNFTFSEVNNLFRYNPETGKLYWKIDKGRAQAGNEAGSTRGNNYKDVKFNGKRTSYARVCWCLHYGQPPKNFIDHIDGNPLNNSISNLRDVTHSQNMKNYPVPRNNVHGYKGIKFDKRSKKWGAAIDVNGKRHWLGTFSEKMDALKARYAAEIEFHGKFRRIV